MKRPREQPNPLPTESTMRTIMKAVVALLPILALASFALMQQAATPVSVTPTIHAQAAIHATPVADRN